MAQAVNQFNEQVTNNNLVKQQEEWKKIGDYAEAEQPRALSSRDKLKMLALLLFDMSKAILLMIPIICRSILELLVPAEAKNITGDVALVTGGGNGLGRAIAVELAKRGAKVAVCDLDGKAAEDTVEILKQMKGQNYQARAYKADVADPASMRSIRDKITDDFEEPVSILVNNAGLMPYGSILKGEDDDYRRVIDVNLLSHFWCIRTFLPSMKERNHGHVVIISSMAGIHAVAGAGLYTSTKFAVRGLAASLSSQLESENSDVKVTCVHPYFIATRRSMINSIEIRMPPLTVEEAAFRTVDGMTRNYRSLSVPSHLLYSAAFFSWLPHAAEKVLLDVFSIKVKRAPVPEKIDSITETLINL